MDITSSEMSELKCYSYCSNYSYFSSRLCVFDSRKYESSFNLLTLSCVMPKISVLLIFSSNLWSSSASMGPRVPSRSVLGLYSFSSELIALCSLYIIIITRFLIFERLLCTNNATINTIILK